MRTEEEILKHNYIIEHLEKGIDKTKETMVLSSFCFDNRLLSIKPIFQHPIKKEYGDSNFLYDLFYPAINLIIEVDEEHHESKKERDNDFIKEKRAKDEINCKFIRIRFHEKYGLVQNQIEEAKTKIISLIKEKADRLDVWKENRFNAEENIKNREKTIMVFVSPSNKITDLTSMPLQIKQNIHYLNDVNIVYFTGTTGTVATAYKVQPQDWNLSNGNSYHTGELNYSHDILTSGSTFYSNHKNILLSPDLINIIK